MKIKGSEAIIKCLEHENVKTIFGYPGGTIVPVYEALRNSNIKHILVRQEQAAGHSASGYARATNTTAVCIFTSGPGATNAITAIATAYMDSIPMVIITGQVRSALIGKDAFQEVDITGATQSFTKHNYLVEDVNEIPRVVKEAFYIAGTGRQGPVLIDVPVDVQNHIMEFEYPKTVQIKGYNPEYKIDLNLIASAVDRLKKSKKPVIYVGGGVISAKAMNEVKTFIEKAKIPLVHTLMGKGAFVDNSPYYLGMIGMHGNICANKAVAEADLIMVIGARMSDRTTAGIEAFAEHSDVIHIDIDPAEISKNTDALIHIVGDAKDILNNFIKEIEPLDTQDWLKEVTEWKEKYLVNKISNKENKVDPKHVIRIVSDMVDDDTIVTADVGQNQIWTAYNFAIRGKRKFFTSGGFGTMGYSLPAAVGAKMGAPDKRVVAFMGDGSFQMSMFELGTISQNNINLIIILFNNGYLGMVRELQHKLYQHDHAVYLQENPDFIKIAEAYGLKGKRVFNDDEFKETLHKALNSDKTYMIECIVDPQEGTL